MWDFRLGVVSAPDVLLDLHVEKTCKMTNHWEVWTVWDAGSLWGRPVVTRGRNWMCFHTLWLWKKAHIWRRVHATLAGVTLYIRHVGCVSRTTTTTTTSTTTNIAWTCIESTTVWISVWGVVVMVMTSTLLCVACHWCWPLRTRSRRLC